MADLTQIQMHLSWRINLRNYLSCDEFRAFQDKILSYYDNEEIEVTPPKGALYSSFDIPFNEVKVLFVTGTLPAKNATGNGFEVKGKRYKTKFIKKLEKTFGHAYPGHLKSWKDQGVMLLSEQLIRSKGIVSYPSGELTQNTVKLLSERLDHLVFVFMGKTEYLKYYVQRPSKHLVLTPDITFGMNDPVPLDFFNQIEEYIQDKHNINITLNWGLF